VSTHGAKVKYRSHDEGGVPPMPPKKGGLCYRHDSSS